MNADRRAAPRLAILPWDGSEEEVPLRGAIQDLSLSGAAFVSFHAIPVGTALTLSFDLLDVSDGQHFPICVQAEVANVVPVEGEGHRIGVHFLSVDDEARLRDYLDDLLILI